MVVAGDVIFCNACVTFEEGVVDADEDGAICVV